MGKLSELELTLRDLRAAAATINSVADTLAEMFSATSEDKPTAPVEKPLTLEAVRAVLADKSRQGFTTQVRDLLLKHGAPKLSQIDPAEYKALLADVEVLGNGS